MNRLVRSRSVVAVLAAVLVALVTSVVGVAPAQAADAPNPTPVYRFYKTTDGSHFFTNNLNEKNQLQAIPNSGYRYEGIAYYAFPTQIQGTLPIYRFYKFAQGVHFFTINQQEADGLKATASGTYRYEGISWYAYPGSVTDSSPVYRFYKFQQGVHFYTSNENEKNQLIATASGTYRYEGIAYYRPTKLHFSGGPSANGSTSPEFILPTGLVRTRTVSSTGHIDATITNVGGTFASYVADRTGAGSGSVAYGYQEDGYLLRVTADSPWSVTMDMPRDSEGEVTSWTGTQSEATNLFTLTRPTKEFTWTVSGPVGATASFILGSADGGVRVVIGGGRVAADGKKVTGTASIPDTLGIHYLDVTSSYGATWVLATR